MIHNSDLFELICAWLNDNALKNLRLTSRLICNKIDVVFSRKRVLLQRLQGVHYPCALEQLIDDVLQRSKAVFTTYLAMKSFTGSEKDQYILPTGHVVIHSKDGCNTVYHVDAKELIHAQYYHKKGLIAEGTEVFLLYINNSRQLMLRGSRFGRCYNHAVDNEILIMNNVHAHYTREFYSRCPEDKVGVFVDDDGVVLVFESMNSMQDILPYDCILEKEFLVIAGSNRLPNTKLHICPSHCTTIFRYRWLCNTLKHECIVDVGTFEVKMIFNDDVLCTLARGSRAYYEELLERVKAKLM